MGELIEIFAGCGTGITLIIIGLVVGRHIESEHFKSLVEREKRFDRIPTTDLKVIPDADKVESAEMIHGSVVVATDPFKRFIGAFRKIFGGEIRVYSSVLERARREALLRMKESHPDADAFFNCRVHTSTISQGNQRKQVNCFEVLAYCTAVRYRK
jgi:uncharacterized protein YbjQ (UPF0145 family)